MNFNNNNNELANYAWCSNTQNHCQQQHVLPTQDYIMQELQHSPQEQQQQQQQQKKKSRGNRKLQRYRRNLRKQGMNTNTITCLTSAWVDIDTRKDNEMMEQPFIRTSSIADATICHRSTLEEKHTNHVDLYTHSLTSSNMNPVTTDEALSKLSFVKSPLIKKQKTNRQANKRMKMKQKLNRSVHMNEVNSLVTIQSLKNTSANVDKLFDHTNIPDQIFYQMLSTAFHGTDKLSRFLNEREMIELTREYTRLIGQLSYVQLQQLQWNYYHHIGMTQHIWTGRIAKHVAEKNSQCYTYGRSKTLIEQRLKQIQEQLQQAQNAVHLFEQQIISKAAPYIHCSSDMQVLSSIVTKFIREHQQKLQNKFEYKRQILILDATDHHLVRTFFHLKPMKSQVGIDLIISFFFQYFMNSNLS